MSESFSFPPEAIGDAGEAGAIIRRQLHDQLLAHIRELIVRGELKPGERIAEKELCGRFNVSRTPLREALKVLAFEGFLTLTPNRGATVTTFTLEDLQESFPVMAALEALGGEMACERITEAEIAAIRRLHGAMFIHFERRELQPYFALNQQIHECIQIGARNETLFTMYRSVSARVRRARLLANFSQERWAQAMAEHELILAALEKRDAAALGPILKMHVANKFHAVRKTLLQK